MILGKVTKQKQRNIGKAVKKPDGRDGWSGREAPKREDTCIRTQKTHVYAQLIHFVVPQKLIQSCKATTCCFSVIKLCPTHCKPRGCSSVRHYFPSLLIFMSIESVMLPNHLILCCPLLLLPSIFPTIRVFSNESFFPEALHIRWPKYWSFSFNMNPSSECSGLISFRTDSLISSHSKEFSRVFLGTTIREH